MAAPLAAGLSVLRAEGPGVVASDQAPPGVPGSPEQWVHVTNADGGPYEKRYGPPLNISACTLTDGVEAPPRQSIRIFGRFDPGNMARRHPEAAPGSTAVAAKPLCDTPGQTGVLRMADLGAPCERVVFSICCEERERRCIQVSPVPEIAGPLEADSESYRNQRVVVVGAFDGAGPGFQFWDFQAMADFAKRRPDGRDSGLRALVAAAGQADKRTVRARGQFRGRNLFGDLPTESRRGSSDWVIADQGVALWITGKAPKGEGWSLDLDARSESVRWVEVEGEVVARDGVIYLKASRVALVGGPLAPPEAVRP